MPLSSPPVEKVSTDFAGSKLVNVPSGAQEPMIGAPFRIYVRSDNDTSLVDAGSIGSDRSRRIKARNCTVGTHKTMRSACAVPIITCDHAGLVDGPGVRVDCARRLERFH